MGFVVECGRHDLCRRDWQAMSNALKFMAAVGRAVPVGEQIYASPGTYSWVCPDGVTSISVVYIGGGGHGTNYGGGGGALGYRNNMAVTPGASYSVVVGAGGVRGADGGASYFISASNQANGGSQGMSGGTFTGGGGGNGGNGSIGSGLGGGGGGAGGYSGAGGNGAASPSTSGGSGSGGGGGGGGAGAGTYSSGGGGTGIYGQGSNGAGGSAGTLGGKGGSGGGNGNASDGTFTNGDGGYYGGGTSYNSANAGAGAPGAVRIIWPGTLRQFPSTRTAYE